jgi:hypothetical protein
MGLRVLVCSRRDRHDADLIESTLTRLNATRGPIECIIDGEARGVDRMAGKWARDHGVLEWGYLPEWHRAGPEGEARNQLMIAETRPDLVVAFPGRCRDRRHGQAGPRRAHRGDRDRVEAAIAACARSG